MDDINTWHDSIAEFLATEDQDTSRRFVSCLPSDPRASEALLHTLLRRVLRDHLAPFLHWRATGTNEQGVQTHQNGLAMTKYLHQCHQLVLEMIHCEDYMLASTDRVLGPQVTLEADPETIRYALFKAIQACPHMAAWTDTFKPVVNLQSPQFILTGHEVHNGNCHWVGGILWNLTLYDQSYLHTNVLIYQIERMFEGMAEEHRFLSMLDDIVQDSELYGILNGTVPKPC
jgi:hypothetical protein